MNNTTNPNFTAPLARITWKSDRYSNGWRTLAAPLPGTAAWDLGADVDETNLFAIESPTKPGVFSYARINPVARKETPVKHASGEYGYRVEVKFLGDDLDFYDSLGFVAWVVLD